MCTSYWAILLQGRVGSGDVCNEDVYYRNAIPGNITISLPGIVYKCADRVNNTRGNEQVMFPRYRVLQ